MSSLAPFKANEEVRDVTSKPSITASDWITSSVSPSLKYSFSGSVLRFAKGRTATT
jgi:hypothetical protein